MDPYVVPWLLEHPADISDFQWIVVRTAGFLALAALVVKLIVPAIRAKLEERTTTVADSLDQVRQALADAEAIRDDYRDKLDHIAEETQRRLDEAVASAAELRSHIESEARQHAEAIIAHARSEARRDWERAMAHLRIEFAEDVIEAASYAAARTLTESRQASLLDAFVREFGEAR